MHSPSSFRFERNIDSAGIDWASRRCCEIILETGGGELLDGVIDVGDAPQKTDPVTLRFSQMERVLGIAIPADFAQKTLIALGLDIQSEDADSITATAPSWRKDLTREVDLIEEVGRVYGFDKVPDDAPVPMAASHKTKPDRVLDKVRIVLTSAGFDEAMTASLVPEKWSTAFSPWTDANPLISSQPMLGVLEKASQKVGAVEFVRRSLVPSLLEARRINEYRANPAIELFETAKVYLSKGEGKIPDQPHLVAFTTGRDFYAAKGIVETLVDSISAGTNIELKTFDHELFDINESGELWVGKSRLGVIGSVSESGANQFGLRSPACIAELDLCVLEELAVLIPIHQNHSMFPSISRDFNFIMNDSVRWSAIESTVRETSGELLESVKYIETFRNAERDGPEKKRVLLSVTLRSPSETLTGEQADSISNNIIDGCKRDHDAVLVG